MIDLYRPLNVCRASAGTGKTYTLAAYYVGLLLSGEDYRSILAITFTNKATAEMSERILAYLYSLSRGEEPAFLLRARQFMVRNTQATDAELAKRAGECFRQMLLDFDNVQIMTIDSFLQTLLSGLAGLLHQSIGQNTEIDSTQVIARAVDDLMTNAEGEVNAVLEKFILSRLAQESQWNVRKDLCTFAQEMYNESVQMLDGENKILFDTDAIARRRERLLLQWKENPYLPQILELLKQLENEPIDESYGKQPSKDLLALIRNTQDSLNNPQKTSKDYLFRGLSDGQWEKAQNGGWKDVPAHITEMAVQLTELSRRCRTLYFTIHLSIALSHEMQLMSALQQVILRHLQENNCALLSRTASVLSDALRDGDADFILEKAGIRYHHVLMDEFQDTSQLQWSVINRLLQDVLAGEGHTLLIVGDIKQSIYRWRNGDWHIMASLGTDTEHYSEQINRDFEALTRNYRSSEQVVNFNLSLFRHIIDHYPESDEKALVQAIYDEGFKPDENLKDFYQADKKSGGYVHFKALLKNEEDAITEMFDRIEELLQRGASPSDIMILVRKGDQATLITEAHAALDAEQYPLLAAAPVVSAQSFLLEASEAVQLIISGLRVVAQQDEVAAKHIEVACDRPDVLDLIREQITLRTPLYEAVSELIRLLLTDEEGRYEDRETAYVNCLLDRTREYVRANGSNIADFLDYWEETLCTKAIPTSSVGAIQIMTIHKSKGLQAQTLFVPFCNWKKDDSKPSQKIWCPIAPELHDGEDFVPIYNEKEMAETSYRGAYEEEHFNATIDSINMLYVALTRAEDNLFVYTEYSEPKTGKPTKNHVGYYLMDLVGGTEYTIGEPVIKSPKPCSDLSRSVAERPDTSKPFSFEHTPTEEAELWANSDQVRFVQSQEGALYTEYGEESYRRVARMDEGTLCHEIFARINKADELESVLDEFESRGEIKDATQRQQLTQLISSAWEGSEQMKDWFTAPWQLKLEETLYINHRKLRPDRVMINPQTNAAIVLDYKFGGEEAKYHDQVREYMSALRDKGYSPVEGYLWYARKNKLEQVQ